MSSIEELKVKLKEEIDTLNHEFKVDLPKRISEAREYGDLKENAEYHAARERQSFVQARIGFLNAQLAQLSEIEVENIPEDKVGFGTQLVVVDIDTDDEIEFSFVAPAEVNPSEGKISLSSPIGAALLGKQAGETVEVSIPAGKRNYFVTKLTTIHGKTFEAEYVEE
jgi:transcription elongation factor GreA